MLVNFPPANPARRTHELLADLEDHGATINWTQCAVSPLSCFWTGLCEVSEFSVRWLDVYIASVDRYIVDSR